MVISAWSGCLGAICSGMAIGISIGADFVFPTLMQWLIILGVAVMNLLVFLFYIFMYKVIEMLWPIYYYLVLL